MKLALLILAAAALASCAGIASSIGLAAAGDLAGGLSTLQQYADAKVGEAQGKAQMYAAAASGIGAALAIAARWVDHKQKAKGRGA